MLVLQFAELTVALLIFARMTAFANLAPFFSLRGAPAIVKAGFGALFAILLFPAVDGGMVESLSTGMFVFLLLKEVLLGLAMGYISGLTFNAIRTAGEFMDIQMGFAMASLFDPLGGSNVTLVGQFLNTMGLLLLLLSNAHHLLISAMVDSFELIPLGSALFGGRVVYEVVEIFVGMFALALRLAAPVLAVLVLATISLGLIARTVPQLNVFILGFLINNGLGMLMLALVMPIMVAIMGVVLDQMARDLGLVLSAMSGGI